MKVGWSTFLFLMFAGLNSKAQKILLNADSAQIKKEVSLHGAVLMKSSIEKDPQTKESYKKMFFRPAIIPPEGNDCLLSMTFCLTLNNKCFKYSEDYWGDKLAYQRINDLKFAYDLKQVKGELNWVNNFTGIELELIPEKLGKNDFASAYLLEFKKTSIKTVRH